MRVAFLVFAVATAISFAAATNSYLSDCRNSLNGCCPDGKTDALGKEREGCGEAMCADMIEKIECLKRRARGECDKGRYGDTDYNTGIAMRRDCWKTCGLCKHHAPRLCEKSPQGCPKPRCMNKVSRIVCERFGIDHCRVKGPRTRRFLREECQEYCGVCTRY